MNAALKTTWMGQVAYGEPWSVAKWRTERLDRINMGVRKDLGSRWIVAKWCNEGSRIWPSCACQVALSGTCDLAIRWMPSGAVKAMRSGHPMFAKWCSLASLAPRSGHLMQWHSLVSLVQRSGHPMVATQGIQLAHIATRRGFEPSIGVTLFPAKEECSLPLMLWTRRHMWRTRWMEEVVENSLISINFLKSLVMQCTVTVLY